MIKKALVVGLNNYPGDNKLECCNNDADEISVMLEDNEDGSPNFDVIKIVDACSKEELTRGIEQLFSDDADVALLYFSGHGCGEDEGSICTTDLKFISMNDIIQQANSSRCKNKVIILDCCFAAKIGQNLLDNNVSVLGNGVTIMASSQDWQSSMEMATEPHGVFTYLLLEGLQGGAADIAGNITPASLYSFVDQSLGPWQQRPVFKTNISQFMPIRCVKPKVDKDILRRLPVYFEFPEAKYNLNPSYEFTNDPNCIHKVIEPYAVSENVEILKELQKLTGVGLVKPVDKEHMYFAAMESGSCQLTELGKHYWHLAKDKRF